MKNNQKSQGKKKSSRNNNHENKENIDIEELEAETARIQREAEKTLDSARYREKRTVSDNSRSMNEQQRPMNQTIGSKILADKTNNMNANGNAFALKRPTTSMMTERHPGNNGY